MTPLSQFVANVIQEQLIGLRQSRKSRMDVVVTVHPSDEELASGSP